MWVAKGTFTPGAAQGDTFSMITGIDVYGGFNATETLLSQRPDPPIGTILSGDIDGIPGTTPGDINHVVTFPPNSNAIRLDGFTIRNGFADVGGGNANGGGILMDGTGGFIFDVIIAQCRIRDNQADSNGAGMFVNQASFGMLFSVLRKNRTMVAGGGMYLSNVAEVNIFSTLFANNRALNGGGLAFIDQSGDSGAGPLVYSCEFRHNRANLGGAVFIDAFNGGSFGNCTLATNEALQGLPPAAPLGEGGGFWVDLNDDFGVMNIYNTVVWFNETIGGGAMGSASSIEGPDAGMVTVTYSDIEINIIQVPPPPSIPWAGAGNIMQDPLFVSLMTNDFNLQSTSPCLDAGHDPDTPPALPGIPPDVLDLDNNPVSGITPFDLVKNNRRETDDPAADTGIDGGAVNPGINDMGAHER